MPVYSNDSIGQGGDQQFVQSGTKFDPADVTTSSHAFGIFAKQPRAGTAKTRLASATSPEFAQRVAQALLEDTIHRFASVRATRFIVHAPDDARSDFESVVTGRFGLMPQGFGDLGARLHRFFEIQRGWGMTRIVVIGSDSPTLPVEHVEQAFAALETHDVVVGPAVDGGYYLIGAGAREVPMFDDIPWSSARVLGVTIARLRAASARVALLPPWYDVDTAEDWAMLCGHLQAMRWAGIDPVTPSLEALIAEQGDRRAESGTPAAES